MTSTEGMFLIVVMFTLFFMVLIAVRFAVWLASFFMDDGEFPVDSGLRKSDVGRANSVWGDKD